MWETVKLGDLCEILDTRRKPITKKDRTHGEYPYYGATGIVDWVADYIFDEELVLIGEDGAKWEAGEKTAFIVDGKYWVNNHAHVVKPNTEKLLNKWLTYYLCGIDLKPWVTGMTVPKLNQGQLKSIPIPLPPLAEQQRIVAKLDAAFAEIDAAIEAVAKSVDDVSRLLESKITDYLSNQNCSRTLTLKDVCEATQGVQVAKSNQSGEELDGYARYLYISDFSHDKNIKYVKNDYPKKTVFPTDIIVVNTGASAGKIFRGIPGILSNNLFKVSPVEALINADFLYHFVNSLIFKKYQAQIMRGTANPHMGHQNFLSTPIQLPEIAGQREIVEMVSCLLRHGETIQKAYIKKKISLSSLKSAILAQELQSEAA